MTTTPDLSEFDLGLGIDLDAERTRRATEREVTSNTLPLRIGGEVVAQLPTELPLDVLAPLRQLDAEITLLLRSVVTTMNQSREEQERWNAASLVIDILATNPALPTTVLNVIEEMAVRLLTREGFDALMAKRPTRDDIAFLGRRLLAFYGLTLGESQPSSPSSGEEGSTDGETLKPTLPTTTPESTPAESGADPEPPASSEPAAS